MYMESMVSDCDFTGKIYDRPVMGADVLAQGATGRWCCVMTIGPEELKRGDITPMSREEVTEVILESLREQNESVMSELRHTEEALKGFLDF